MSRIVIQTKLIHYRVLMLLRNRRLRQTRGVRTMIWWSIDWLDWQLMLPISMKDRSHTVRSVALTLDKKCSKSAWETLLFCRIYFELALKTPKQRQVIHIDTSLLVCCANKSTDFSVGRTNVVLISLSLTLINFLAPLILASIVDFEHVRPTNTSLKSITETLEEDVKYVRS